MTGDCVNVDIVKAGRLLQTKPAYGGNIVSVIMSATTPQLATVRPRMFEPLEPRDVAGEVHRVTGSGLRSARTAARGARRAAGGLAARRSRARRAGRAGLRARSTRSLRSPGSPAPLSAEPARSAAAGLLPWSHHVGLFGRPVAPRVLVAVGVPGDFEHLTGFVKADVVVALPEAGWPADVVLLQERQALRELVPRLATSV